MMISFRSVDDSMPQIMGTAIRCMISELAPLLHMIGSKPAMMATTRDHLQPHALDGTYHDGVVKIV